MPRFILRGEYSINAKLLYALLLGRTQLSQKSGWVSEDGDVYVIYTIRQIANDLNRSERTVKAALAELENAGLVVNKRLLTGKPMIVTTNIPLSVMQKASDLDERRIYDRVLEVCVPIQFNGENFRKGNAVENVKRAAKILNQTN